MRKVKTLFQRTTEGFLHGLTAQLFLLVVLPLTLLVILVTFGSLSTHHQVMHDLVAERNLRAVRAAAGELERELSNRTALVEHIARFISSADEFRQQANTLTDVPEGLALLDKTGAVLFAAGGAESWQEEIPLNQILTASAQAQSIVHQGRTGNRLERIWIVDRTQDGSWLVGMIPVETVFRQTLAEIIQSDTVTIKVIDVNQNVIFQTDTPSSASGPAVNETQGSPADFLSAPGNQRELIVSSAEIAPYGWTLVLSEPWDRVSSPLLQATQYAPLILVPVVLLALLALWFGLRQIIQPLKMLQDRAANLAEGDFSSLQRPVGGISEIQSLQNALAKTAARLRIAQETLRNYIGALTAGVEAERKNLARELHDETLQSLIALNQHLQFAQYEGTAGQEEALLSQMQHLVEQIMLNLRRVVGGLRPIYLEDLGLSAAVEMLSNEIGQQSKLETRFTGSGTERRLAPESEMAFYRIAQEALSNVTRHADASQVNVELKYRPNSVILNIADNGKGFQVPKDTNEFARRGHFGLLGLRERAELIGASLSIESSPRGTRVTVRFEEPKQNP